MVGNEKRAPGGLTKFRKRFCQEYIIDLNASAAYRRAGGGVKSAGVEGFKLLKKEVVQAEIQKLMNERAQRTEITADRVLEELARLAFANLHDFIDFEGKIPVLNLTSMTAEKAAAIKKLVVEPVTVSDDEGNGRTVHSIKRLELADKHGPLVDLGRHLKLFTDKTELNASQDLIDVLRAVDGATRGLPNQQRD